MGFPIPNRVQQMSVVSVVAIQSFMLIMFRVLAVFMLAPVLSLRSVPSQLKIALAFFITLILWPAHGATLAQPLPWLVFASMVVRESFVGAVIGYSAHLFTAAAEIGGSVVDLQVGFRAANLVNPLTSLPSSIMDQVYFLLASLLFLIVDGHHALIRAVAATYEAIPLGASVSLSGDLGVRLTTAVSSALSAGVRIALPVLAVTLMLDIVLAILSRAVPQIQVFFVGLPIKLGLGMAVILITLPATVAILRRLLGDVPGQVAWLLQGL